MKRSWAALAILTLGFALGSPLAAAAVASEGRPADAGHSVRAGVQDFEFESYSADYYLGRDAQGHATLRTVETFVARFPSFDQNRGMIRAIPNDYDGVPLLTDVQSVVDENGADVPYEETVSGGFTELALGTDDFVHGRTTYTITYTQQNVVRAFADTSDDEFYWDTNGTGFPQPFGTVSARVHLDPALTQYLTGNNACYRGGQGATDTCPVEHAPDAAGDVFTASVRDIGAYENLTVVIGFTLGTFVQVPAEVEPDDGFPGDVNPFFPGQTESPWWLNAASIGSVLLIVLGTAFTVVWRFVKPASAKGSGIIVPQYTPPKELNLLEAAEIIGRRGSGLPAQIVSFAVRGRLRILDYPVTGSGASYTLQLLDLDGLDPTELDLMKALFGDSAVDHLARLQTSGILDEATMSAVASFFGGDSAVVDASLPQIGAIQEVGVVDDAAATAIAGVRAEVRRSVMARGLLQKRSPLVGILAAVFMFVMSFVSMGLFMVSIFFTDVNAWGIVGFLLAILGCFVCAGFAYRPAVASAAGAVHRDYLLGIRDYLQLAEADRFRMLQSPEGAERVRAEGLDIRQPAQRVKLYEKLLPFAVLWGVEREWTKELTILYGETAPDWFVSTGSFDGTVFSSALGSISTSTIARQTVRSSSSGSSWSRSGGGSFSGGSFGGGFSGGGGGGGGGGGR
ncbi:hypothetical protein GCM10022239_26740 [Leifsonia bigeumensis]|uniref:DUF2207 domain-containing protein n=1 Tax=Leifsonella bigeumensis TaxID=433643 RepID=A0ABP7FZR8_9MICO